MFVEVESNDNCETSVFARFKEIGQAKPVLQVKTYDRKPEGEWCSVTGWSDDPVHPCCPAYVQLVEDSGAGMTHLVYGGLFGIRLKPASLNEDWSLDSPHQWGEPYLSLGEEKDILYKE